MPIRYALNSNCFLPLINVEPRLFMSNHRDTLMNFEHQYEALTEQL